MKTVTNIKRYGSFKKNKMFYLMLLPVVVYYIVFCYTPMFGIIVAFTDYKPRRGFLASEWIGLQQYYLLFRSADFSMFMKNTILMSLYKIVWGFPAPIILALMINEVGNSLFKRYVQTVSYMPHFLSWVVVAQLVQIVFASDGPLNQLRAALGADSIQFMVSRSAIRSIVVISNIWKQVGWGTLIYLAAIAGIDPSLYESAVLDGANRLQQIKSITLPSILPTIIVLLILRMGSIMSAGFEDIILLQNTMTYDLIEVLDVYVYKVGIQGAQYSFATAVGLFKSVIGMCMVLITNAIARKCGDSSLL